MDERRLTFIVVPHGDLETKTFEISYRKLRWLIAAAVVLAATLTVMVGLWWYIALKAAEARSLERENASLRQERVKVDSLAALLSDVEGQYQRVRELLGANAAVEGQSPTLPALPGTAGTTAGSPPIDSWPLVQRGYITREFPADGSHPGLDIAVPASTFIRAAGAGTISSAGTDSVYGKYLLINHGGGIETLYGHASRLLVSPGDQVKRQQLIALSGSTGKSTAPHLHFEVRLNGTPVDPRRYVRQP